MKRIVSIMFAVMLVVLSAVPAFATESPTAATYKYTVEIIPTGGGDGTYEFTTEIDENGEQVVHLTPLPNSGYTFDHWVIEGSYTTEGELTDGELDIVITSDIKATPYYTKDGSATVATGTVSKDTGSTSPKTGANDFIPYAVMMLSVLACGAAVTMLVKTGKSK